MRILLSWKADILKTDRLTLPSFVTAAHSLPHTHTHMQQAFSYCWINSVATHAPASPASPASPELPPYILYTPIGTHRLQLYARFDNLTCEQTCSKMPDWHFWNVSKHLACAFFFDPPAPGVGSTPKHLRNWKVRLKCIADDCSCACRRILGAVVNKYFGEWKKIMHSEFPVFIF